MSKQTVKIEILDSSDSEVESRNNATNGRKRKFNNRRPEKNQSNASKQTTYDDEEVTLSPTGRPKRQCRMKKKTSYTDVDPPAEESADESDKSYNPESDKEATSSSNTVQHSINQERKGVVVVDVHSKPKSDILEKAKQQYKWIDHDEDTGKIRCTWCMKNNLRKWFIYGGDHPSGLMESFKLHQLSEEHTRSCAKSSASTEKNKSKEKSNTSSNPQASKLNNKSPVTIVRDAVSTSSTDPNYYRRDVYCLPIECMETIPIPDVRLRNLLEKHGLKGSVLFLPTLTPARLRDDISKAFSKTFKLRTQELLQFDYLALTESRTELTKPHKLLHFNGKTVLSFIGKSHVYILLKQKSPVPDICWKELLFQEDQLRNLSDNEYREVMLSVMYRLSSKKHKKEATDEQKQLVDSLLDSYQLNNYHQLVYTGNGFQQLVLFQKPRRDEAFSASHGNHLTLEKTFKNLFKQYFWNGIDSWCVDRVGECEECMEKYGEDLLKTEIPLEVIMEDLIRTGSSTGKQKQNSRSGPSKTVPVKTVESSQSRGQSSARLTPKRPIAKSEKQDPPGGGVVVPLPSDTNGMQEHKAAGVSPSAAMNQASHNRGSHWQQQQQAAIPTPSVTHQPATNISNPPDGEMKPPFVVKKEPEELLPPSTDIETDLGLDRDGTLYEEDLDQAIERNSRNMNDGSHCTNAMWSMYLLQQRGMYCDFFIMLLPSLYNGLKKPKIYGVHKVVFAAISGRIRNISKTTIKIGGKVTCEGLESVIEFGYTGRLTGVSELKLANVAQISSTALALDIKIDHYLQKHRPDFVKTSARVLVSQNPQDMMAHGSSGKSTGDITFDV